VAARMAELPDGLVLGSLNSPGCALAQPDRQPGDGRLCAGWWATI
jgi:hypothetical protein